MEPTPNPNQSLTDEQRQWVELTLEAMTPQQIVGQLFCAYLMPERLTAQQQIEEYAVRIRDEIGRYAPAGYYLNRYYIGATPLLIDLMQMRSEVPLFIAADMECGAGGGLGGVIAPCLNVFPPAMAIGATGFDPYAYLAAYHTAVEAKAIGVNWVFAPVMDVNNNPENPIINIRSYGEDPELVARMAAQAVKGFHKGGVISCGKHFPGHGDTADDTHLDLAVIEADRERLESLEWVPYRRLIEAGELCAIMTAHIAVPSIDNGQRRAATLSPAILKGVLRDELGFEGLIVTDAMLMGGVANHFDPGEAAVLALEAGADLILMPPDFPAAYKGVEAALDSGRLSFDEVKRSIRRTLSLKASFGLSERHPVSVERIDDLLESNDAPGVCESICGDAITLVSARDGALPIDAGASAAVLTCFDHADEFCDYGEAFIEEIEDHARSVQAVALLPNSVDEVYHAAHDAIDSCDAIIVGAVINVLPDKGNVTLPERMAGLIDAAIASGKPCVIVAFGSPYLARRFEDASAFLCGYGYVEAMCEAAAGVIYGVRKARGTLPVRLTAGD